MRTFRVLRGRLRRIAPTTPLLRWPPPPAVASVDVRRRAERTRGEWSAQDIAVDGWAISMLSKRNVGLASTANAVGQTAGLVISFTGYLVLNSWGLVGLGGFLRFWGAVFVVSAGLVFFTREKPSTQRISVVDAYSQVTMLLALDGQRMELRGWRRGGRASLLVEFGTCSPGGGLGPPRWCESSGVQCAS